MTMSSDGRPVTNEKPSEPVREEGLEPDHVLERDRQVQPELLGELVVDPLDVLRGHAAVLVHVEQHQVDGTHRRQPHEREHEHREADE